MAQLVCPQCGSIDIKRGTNNKTCTCRRCGYFKQIDVFRPEGFGNYDRNLYESLLGGNFQRRRMIEEDDFDELGGD